MRFILMVILGILLSFLLISHSPSDRYRDLILNNLLHYGNNENFISRVIKLYRGYFILILQLGFSLYFAQLSFIGNTSVYWGTYFITAGFLFFMARCVYIHSGSRTGANFEFTKYVFGLSLLGFVAIFLAIIHILMSWVKNPGRLLDIITSLLEGIFPVDYFWGVLIFLVFPLLLAVIGELVITPKSS